MAPLRPWSGGKGCPAADTLRGDSARGTGDHRRPGARDGGRVPVRGFSAPGGAAEGPTPVRGGGVPVTGPSGDPAGARGQVSEQGGAESGQRRGEPESRKLLILAGVVAGQLNAGRRPGVRRRGRGRPFRSPLWWSHSTPAVSKPCHQPSLDSMGSAPPPGPGKSRVHWMPAAPVVIHSLTTSMTRRPKTGGSRLGRAGSDGPGTDESSSGVTAANGVRIHRSVLCVGRDRRRRGAAVPRRAVGTGRAAVDRSGAWPIPRSPPRSGRRTKRPDALAVSSTAPAASPDLPPSRARQNIAGIRGRARP